MIENGRLVQTIIASQGYKRSLITTEGDKSFIDSFNLRPSEVVDYLNEWIIGQEKAKWTLATKICSHLNGIRHEMELGLDPMDNDERVKSNILLIGPTGSGKTYVMRKTAKKFGIPFVKADATKFSETGYVGRNVDEIIRDLFKNALSLVQKDSEYKNLKLEEQEDKAVELAQYGIVFIDEFDKLAERKGFFGGDVSRGGVQRGLLTLTEETDVPIIDTQNPMEAIKIAMAVQTGQKIKNRMINTRNIIFIFSGVFAGLQDIIQKRNDQKKIGFGADFHCKSKETNKLWDDLIAEDLMNFGIEGELVGRIPVRVVLDRLSEDDLFQILKNPKSSIVLNLKNSMAGYGIKVDFGDDILCYAAKLAYKQNTGARGLVSAFDGIFQKFEAYLPDIPINYLMVTKELINLKDKKEFLNTLNKELEKADLILEKDHVAAYQKYLLKRWKVALDFSPGAINALKVMADSDGITPCKKCQRMFLKEEERIAYYSKRGIRRYLLDKEFLNDVSKCLVANIIKQMNNIQHAKEERVWRYKKIIKEKYDITLKTSGDFVKEISRMAIIAMKTPFEICEEIFRDYDGAFHSLRGKELLIEEKDIEDISGFFTRKIIENKY